jgi:hypothetical protein
MWATTDQIREPGRTWLSLMEMSAVSGFVPIVLDGLEGQPERPWDSGELDPRPHPTPDDLDEAIVFRQRWNMGVPAGLLPPSERPRPLTFPGAEFSAEPEFDGDDEEREFLELSAPWGIGFPGLGLAERAVGDPETFQRAVEGAASGRIGLVETRRPADVLHTIGWLGAVNHFVSESGATPLSVMTAPVNLGETESSGNHCAVVVASSGRLIHAAVGSSGGVGTFRTNRSGWAA